MQSGSYNSEIADNKISDFYFNGEKKQMGVIDFRKQFADYLAKEINSFEYESILEAGIGECTSAAFLVPKLKKL